MAAPKIEKLLTPYNFTNKDNAGRIKYIVIHYVGALGGAEANCKYYASKYLGASAHYFVGFNGEVWQSVEDEDIAWHCGASSYKHAECRNSNSIGIEMCVRNKGSQSAESKDWYFEEATVNAAIELTKYLMQKYGVPASNVIRHHDVTGKICPNPYVYNSTKHTWDAFKKAISGGTEQKDSMTKITGKSEATAEQMTAYIKAKNGSVAQSVLDMIPLYLSEGEAENIRGDIAFAQSCLETGNFTFSGSAVELSQNNFCGMGVTQNGETGNSFKTPQLGIRAQIQHLKAWMIYSKLRMSPLRFIRRDLSKSKRKKAVKLPHFRFFTRFRIRVILQNLPSYIVLFIGVTFAIVLLMFGMMMSPLLKHYQDETLDNMLADYQYVLKMPVETENKDAEKYLVTSLIYKTDIRDEEVMVYGISDDSKYSKVQPADGEMLISDGLRDKYKLKNGDTITLDKEYSSDSYKIKVSGVCTYPAALAVFMNEKTYREMFDVEEGYFSGYFSNEKLTDIDEKLIATVVTEEDLTKVSRQLDRSMGQMFYMFEVFALAMFMLMVYLLTKLIIERNTISISMVKILGYENKEINRLYLSATTWVMAVCVILGIILSQVAIAGIYYVMMKEAISGWMTIYIAPYIYPAIFILAMAAYGIIAVFQVKRIKRIPMDEALKNVE